MAQSWDEYYRNEEIVNSMPEPIKNHRKDSQELRGLYGWSPEDTWGMDSYIAEVIAGMCEYQAENAHGWPGEPMTYEEWQEILRKIANGFRRYVAWRDSDDDADFTRDISDDPEFKEAFDLFRQWFPHLWD